MYDSRTTNPFYSTSREAKRAALPDVIGMNVVQVLDDISDGCGGTESARFIGHPTRWATVFDDRGGRCEYAVLTVHPDEPTVITHAVIVEMAWTPGQGAQDSRLNLMAAINAADSFAAMANGAE